MDSNTSFMSYFHQDIDTTIETQLYKVVEFNKEELDKIPLTSIHRKYAEQKYKDEQYRLVRRFAKQWSKINKKISSKLDDLLDNFANNFTLDTQLKKLHPSKIDKQDFKSFTINGLTSFSSMNSRIVLYNSILTAVNSIDRIITEDIEDDNLLGNTLTKLLEQVTSCGFTINLEDKDISDYTSYIDITSAFTSINKTLGELDYIPNDVCRFAMTMSKLKTNILNTSLFLQNRLKSQPSQESNSSDNTTIIGLLYYSLPNDEFITMKARMMRIAVLTSLFNSICHYSFDIDFNSTIELLNTAISVQK